MVNRSSKWNVNFKKILGEKVLELEVQNRNNDKQNVVFHGGMYTIDRIRGGTKVESGHVLGVPKDYDSHSDAVDRIEEGTRCSGSYKGLVIQPGRKYEEVFDMLSKEDVDSFTKALLEMEPSFLSEDTFPSLIEGQLFWSTVYHYHQSLDDRARPSTLLSLYKNICAKSDWDAVAGRGRGEGMKRN